MNQNMLYMMQQFNQFRNQFQGGNPNNIISNMVNSGQVSQQQVEAAVAQAQQLQQFINGGRVN